MSKRHTSIHNEYAQRIYALVRQIPPGQVATYGQIATWVSPPSGVAPAGYRAFGARWVGRAMSRCPDDVPWQRVVNAQGKISLHRGAGFEEQRLLLEMEGIEFDAQLRIDLKRFAWSGPETKASG